MIFEPIVAAVAPSGAGGAIDNMTQTLCQFISPAIGHGPVLAVIFLLVGVMTVILWFLGENKEGMILWTIRAGIVLGLLIEAGSILSMFGFSLPSGC